MGCAIINFMDLGGPAGGFPGVRKLADQQFHGEPEADVNAAKEAEDALMEAQVNERTRIAREIRGTLLQSFHGLLLQLQVVSRLLPECPMEAKERLDTAIQQLADAITEGRDAVQGLRESTVPTNQLAFAISKLGEELTVNLAGQRAPSFRVTVEGNARSSHPILRDEVYRIAAEALRNAFRHAHARHIEVEIRYGDWQFRIRVRDDGKGIDAAILSGQEPAGHFGLPGMRELAKLIGGSLVVWSKVDAGTEVELRIPAATAYAAAPLGARLSRLLTRRVKESVKETTR